MSEVSVIDFKGTAGKRQVKDKISRDAITSNIETNDTSSKNYNSGEYILWKGVYYKTKVAITSGTTFVVGTNIEETTISDALYDIAGSSGATSLSDLTDTSITSPANGQVLKFNGTTNKWENDDDVEIKTATGNPITLTDAVAGNALEVSAEIVASQDLHGYDKPWVGGAGKNKVDMPTAAAFTVRGYTLSTAANGETSISGTSTAGAIDGSTFILPAGTYTISVNSALPSGIWVSLTGVNDSLIAPTNDHQTFTISDATEVYIHFWCNAGVELSNYKLNLQLETGQTATSYEPYSNICPITGFSSVTITDVDSESHTATVTVALGQTVYGGTLDLTSGELTVDRIKVTPDSTTEWVQGSASNNYRWRIYLTDASSNYDVDVDKKISSVLEYKTSVYSDSTADIGFIINGGSLFARFGAEYDTLAKVQALCGSTTVEFCYPLATPTTTTLTPAQLALVKGYNQLTCNSGDMEITYKASGLDALKERVDDLEDTVADLETDMASKAEKTTMGTVESGTTASQAYAVGEHFIRNDKFCTVIAAIASGATLTQGTNYVEGTIAECIARQGTYSTTETEIGTWLGQRLYRKVVDCGNMPSATSKDVSSGLSGIRVHKIYGNFNTSTTVGPLPFVAESINSGIKMFYNYTTNKIHLETATDFSNFTGEVVLEYTKNS